MNEKVSRSTMGNCFRIFVVQTVNFLLKKMHNFPPFKKITSNLRAFFFKQNYEKIEHVYSLVQNVRKNQNWIFCVRSNYVDPVHLRNKNSSTKFLLRTFYVKWY